MEPARLSRWHSNTLNTTAKLPTFSMEWFEILFRNREFRDAKFWPEDQLLRTLKNPLSPPDKFRNTTSHYAAIAPYQSFTTH